MSLIGPDRISQRFDHARLEGGLPERGRRSLADVVAIQRQMIRQLVDAGCRYVQIDEPGYTAYVDEPSLDAMRKRGEDPTQNFARSLRAERARWSQGFPGVTFGIHLCRGNQRSMWHREGSYDAIAERLFNELPHQRFLLEYDSPRAGSFAPLRFVPKGKVVVLGLVSTKVPELESVDELERRIDEAAKYVPLEQLADQPAVRLRLRRGRQPDQRGRPEAQARARGRARAQGVGMSETPPLRPLRLDRGFDAAPRARSTRTSSSSPRRPTRRASTAYLIAEHQGTPLSIDGSPSVLLSAIFQRTRRLRAGALTFCLPWYDPYRLYNEICMLDQLSGGRLELGVGRGVSPIESRIFGLQSIEESREKYRETLDSFFAACAGPTLISYSGSTTRTRAAHQAGAEALSAAVVPELEPRVDRVHRAPRLPHRVPRQARRLQAASSTGTASSGSGTATIPARHNAHVAAPFLAQDPAPGDRRDRRRGGAPGPRGLRHLGGPHPPPRRASSAGPDVHKTDALRRGLGAAA